MPGPLPQYRPSFPEEFVAEASRLAAARTAASHLKQRAEMVLLLHGDPSLSNVEVGARLGVHPNCVRRWRQRWATGNFGLLDQPGRGRKAAFSPPR